MPVVPTQPALLSTDVPGASAAPSGREGIAQAGLASLGQDVAQVGLDMLTNLKQAEAVNSVGEAKLKLKMDAEDFSRQLELQNEGGNYVELIKDKDGKTVGSKLALDPKGQPIPISQKYQEWAAKRFKEDQEKLPSYLAQQMYLQQARPYLGEEIESVKNKQHALLLGKITQDQNERLNTRANLLVDQPSLGRVYDASRDTALELMANVGKSHSLVFAREKSEAMDKQYAESAGRGAVNQVLSIPQKQDKGFARRKLADAWLTLLREDPNNKNTLSRESLIRKNNGQKIFSEMFDPDKKAELERQLIAAREMANKHDLMTIDAQVAEAASSFRLGEPQRFTREAADKLAADINTAVSEGHMAPEIAAQKYAVLAMTRTAQEIPSRIVFMPPAQRDGALKGHLTTAGYEQAQKYLGANPATKQFGSLVQEQATADGQRLATTFLSQSQNDWAEFVQKNGFEASVTRQALMDTRRASFANPGSLAGLAPQLRDELKKSEQMHSMHFPTEPQTWRPFTKEQSASMVEYFTNVTVPVEQKAIALRTMLQEYGSEYFPKVMSQLIEDNSSKGFGKEWYFASLFAGSQTLTTDVIKALTADPNSEENKTVMKLRGLNEETMRASLGQVFDKFILASSQQSPGDPFYDLAKESVIRVAKNKALALMKNGRANDFGAASQMAYDSLVKDNWYVLDARGSSGLFGTGLGAREYSMIIPKRVKDLPITPDRAQAIVDYSLSLMDRKKLESLGVALPKTPDGKTTMHADQFFAQVTGDDGRVVVNQKTGMLEVWWFDRYSNTDRQVTNKMGGPLTIPVEKALDEMKNSKAPPVYAPNRSMEKTPAKRPGEL